jgi:hypothetical protein
MGNDDTARTLGEKFAGIPTLLRGNRSSPAVLSGDETTAQLNGLADDVLMFSGLGCRNVSMVFVPRDYDFSELRHILAAREADLDRRRSNNLRHSRAMLRMTGATHIDAGAVLLVEARDFSASPGVLNYTFYDSPAEVDGWLAAHSAGIQCVACSPGGGELRIALRSGFHLRTVALGQTQHPRLDDYPDGVDTMKFLTTI